jgi:hypothetical protein
MMSLNLEQTKRTSLNTTSQLEPGVEGNTTNFRFLFLFRRLFVLYREQLGEKEHTHTNIPLANSSVDKITATEKIGWIRKQQKKMYKYT